MHWENPREVYSRVLVSARGVVVFSLTYARGNSREFLTALAVCPAWRPSWLPVGIGGLVQRGFGAAATDRIRCTQWVLEPDAAGNGA